MPQRRIVVQTLVTPPGTAPIDMFRDLVSYLPASNVGLMPGGLQPGFGGFDKEGVPTLQDGEVHVHSCRFVDDVVIMCFQPLSKSKTKKLQKKQMKYKHQYQKWQQKNS